MQLSKVMLAVATLAVGASAFAAPNAGRIAISAGASATRANLITALTNLCTAAGGTTSSLGSGNFRSIVCANSTVTNGTGGTYVSKINTDFIDFAGTPYAEVRLNTEGSFSAVLLLNTPLNPNPAVWDAASGAAGAASAVYPAGSVRVGGLLDLEPTAFPSSTIGANTLFTATPAGFAQTFGVAVTKDLYGAMFAAQQTSGFIPATCTLASTGIPACVPSIGKAQMATIMADNPFNAAYSNGLGFLTGVVADNGKELRYVRRVDNSGTQAAAQNYFLGLPCSKNGLSIVAQPTSDDEAGGLKDALVTSIRVLAAPGTGDVLADLTKLDSDPLTAGDQPIYGIGVVSGENNVAANWQWIRVGGAPIGENSVPATAGITNSATLRNGTYDFYYESVYMGGSAAGNAFWTTVSAALNSLTLPVGLVNASQLAAGYNKAGLSCLGSASN
jgi:hypothetical protein